MITAGLIELLLGVPDLACVPIRFGATEAAQHLSHVFRLVGATDHVKLSEAIVKSCDDGMRACSVPHEKWAKFEEDMDPDFRKLRALGVRLSYLGETVSALGYQHQNQRVSSSLLKAIRREGFLEGLGELLKILLVQHAALKSPDIKEDSLEMDTSENGKESGAKFLATRMYTIITKFLRSINRLLFVKRMPEASRTPEALAVIKAISRIMAETFEVEAMPDKEVATLNQALAFNAAMLFDGEYEPPAAADSRSC
jgi:E3 ubiquitin-protein ligase HUWE1